MKLHLDSAALSLWCSGSFNFNTFAYRLWIICPVNVRKFCPVFSLYITVCIAYWRTLPLIRRSLCAVQEYTSASCAELRTSTRGVALLQSADDSTTSPVCPRHHWHRLTVASASSVHFMCVQLVRPTTQVILPSARVMSDPHSPCFPCL